MWACGVTKEGAMKVKELRDLLWGFANDAEVILETGEKVEI